MKESTFKKYCLVVDVWLTNGFVGRKAYQEFYPDATDETADVNFSKILSITKVAEYATSRQSDKSNELGITLTSQLLELSELKRLSKEDNRFNDAINAVKEQNKLLALYKEHNEQQSTKIVLPSAKEVKEISKKLESDY